ncbi:MAG: hypothetical protein ACLQOO_37640 [Terriglobia bacterium]
MKTAQQTPGDFVPLLREPPQLSPASNPAVNICQYPLEKICGRLDQ